MHLGAILDSLTAFPTLQNITVTQLFSFITLASNLKQSIQLTQPASEPLASAPAAISTSIAIFLSRATSIPLDDIPNCWHIFKDLIWDTPPEVERHAAVGDAFKVHGWILGITIITLFPPSKVCENSDCPYTKELKKEEARQVVVHTLHRGTQPAWAIHLRCPTCGTNYRYNFFVHPGSEMRTYYPGIPDFIQMGEHQFVDRRLAELWTNQHLVGSCSATNAGKLYEMSLAGMAAVDFEAIDWPFSPQITTEQVWNTFVILALLRDYEARNISLTVPHTGLQKDRFTHAMEARNERIIRYGQPELTHYCDGCMRTFENEGPDGQCQLSKCQPIVSDGITLGHPCCGVFRCTEPLQNNRRRFCESHAALQDQCAVDECERPVHGADSKTCDDPLHTKIEELHYAKGKSAFSLSQRLLRHRVAFPSDATGITSTQDIDDLDENTTWYTNANGDVQLHFEKHGGCVGVRDDGVVDEVAAIICEAEKTDKKFKALFARRKTSNEQTLVWPCGIIVGRATMHGAEAVSNVLQFLKAVFTLPGAHKPEHFIYDTACDAKRQADAQGDEWFQDIGMVVDVWHLLNKHKTTHEYCQIHCNPADFPELMKENGQGWWFNTSVAEQINVWLGSYHSICREMLAVKYNFFWMR